MATGMRTALSCLLLSTLACGGSPRLPARPLGVHDHLVEADRHEADARAHDELASSAEQRAATTPRICGDDGLSAQATSGGERLTPSAPCWTSEADAVERHRQAAARLRADARAHRAHARALHGAELEACAGLPEAEIGRSPFDHRDDVIAVAAELDGDRLRGARVTFAPVPGLSAAWMRRALACHQAQAAALGNDPTFLPHCPAAVAGVRTEVREERGGLVVVIRAEDPATALIVYGRAEALIDAGAAGR